VKRGVCVLVIGGVVGGGVVGGCAGRAGGLGDRGGLVEGGQGGVAFVADGGEVDLGLSGEGAVIGESLEEFGFVGGAAGGPVVVVDGVEREDGEVALTGGGAGLRRGGSGRGGVDAGLEEVAGWRLPRVRGEALPVWWGDGVGRGLTEGVEAADGSDEWADRVGRGGWIVGRPMGLR